ATYKRAQLAPEILTHRHHGKAVQFVTLLERQRLEGLVERAESTRHHHKRPRVLHQHHFPHKEVIDLDEPVQVWIRALLHWKNDVAAQAQPTGFACSAVRSLHDSGAAT